MLKIWIGNLQDERYIDTPSVYFDNAYDDNWLRDAFAKEVIADIDQSELIDVDCVKSQVLGMIPITRIAGGTKTLILMKNDSEHIFNASSCGDNCARWILQIAEEKDLIIRLGHIMRFPDSIEAIILNSGVEVKGYKQYVSEYLKVTE